MNRTVFSRIRGGLTGFVAVVASVSLITACSGSGGDNGDEKRTTITLFASPNTDSAPLWAALDQGFYEDLGLEVQVKAFPSGTTALQAFRTGQGDITMSGELPAVQYWDSVDQDYQVLSPITRHTEGYVVQALAEIKTPKDLIGKTVATRVGSTGSWFVSEFLAKNGIKEDQVKVINLDTNQMPIALDKGEIAAFFVWQPFGLQSQELSGDKVHTLSTAEGYVRGYTVIGARPAWLEKNKDAAVKFVEATDRGAEYAAANPEQLATYLDKNYGQPADQTLSVMKYIDLTMAFDEQFFDDFTSVSTWALNNDTIENSMDFSAFLWPDGLRAIDQGRVTSLPPAE